MRTDRSSIKSILTLELDVEQSFPIAECLISGLIILVFYFVLSAPFGLYCQVIPMPGWDGNSYAVQLSQEIGLEATLTFARAVYNLSFVLAILIPMLTALTMTRGIDSGFLRTQLSYPVGRKALVVAKSAIVLTTTVLPSSLAALLAVSIFEPGPKDIKLILLLFVSLWAFSFMAVSLSFLLSMISRALPSALLSSITVFFALTLMPLLTRGAPGWVSVLINPVWGACQFITGTYQVLSIDGLLLGMTGNLLMVAFLFCLGFYLFRTLEI